MKILLIQAYTMLDEPPVFPLGLSYIATVLTGHEIRLFDMNTSENPLGELKSIIEEFSPDVIGYSMRNMKLAMPGVHVSCFEPHQVAIKSIKASAPGVPIVAGGTAYSLYAREIMRRVPEIDMGVFGEGEETFKELISNLGSPEKVLGVYYRSGGDVLFTGFRERPDFSKLPMPRRDLVDLKKYTHMSAIGVETTRGCAFRCVHCSDLYLLGGVVRTRPAKSVVDEVEMLVNKYGVKSIMFADQIFNFPADHAKEICREMIHRGVKVSWTGWFTPLGLDDETVELAKKAGCSLLIFTPDSVDDDVLMRIRKGISYKDIEKSIKIAKAQKMTVGFNFLINLPGETLGSIAKMLWFTIRHKVTMGRLFSLHGCFIVPVRIYPHTEIHELSVKEGIVDRADDLIEARFYSPKSVVTHFGNLVVDLLTSLWTLKNLRRAIKRRRRLSASQQ